MANVAHSGLTGSDLHEPKGVASANASEVYVADGAASGSFTALSTLVTSTVGHIVPLTVRIPNIETAGSYWVVSPVAGTIDNWYVVLDKDPAADATLTMEIATVAVTGSSMVVATAGWALNTVDTAAPSAAKTIGKGAAIEIINDGTASGTDVEGIVTISITRTD